LASWLVAGTASLRPRERAIVAVSGLTPDVDGLGIGVDLVTRNTAHETNLWGDYHHVLGHNLLLAMIVAGIGFTLARRNRWKTAALVLLVTHLHLLCDVLGGRGPDGHQWPIPYLWPFSTSPEWVWSGQWALNAWPNFVITAAFIVATMYLAWKKGFSPVEIISRKWDERVVATLRSRFPANGNPGGDDHPPSTKQ